MSSSADRILAGLALAAAAFAADAGGLDPARAGHYGYGNAASAEQIAGWDIDVRPDGTGLPPGSGSAADGEMLYEEKCAECHGSFGEGVGRYPVLAGGMGTLRDPRPTKTVGSYWPYASTLFDYIRRAMPFTAPESLSDDETYALTAYVLYLNDLIPEELTLNRETLPDIHLPNEGHFVPDPRPDTHNKRCMRRCKKPDEVRIAAEVTPAYVPLTKTAAPVEHADPGKAVYERYCSICHATGIGGAPVAHDERAWAPRRARGLDALVRSAIEGKTSAAGVMPPKGGFSQLSDAEVGAAVRFMLEGS